ncbi:MAG: hypothetical protein V4655_08820 [Bdellovibrionota bacterium]
MKTGLRLWSLILTVSLILVPTIICGGLLYFYLKSELDNRRMITFLNFEQLAQRFDRSLDQFTTFASGSGSLQFKREPVALMQKKAAKIVAVRGQMPEGLMTNAPPESSCDTQNVAGSLYLICPLLLPETQFHGAFLSAGYYWGLWTLDKGDLALFADVAPTRIFLLDSRGKPVFQSDRAEPQEALLKKPLVQEFIRTPLTRSGSAPYTDSGMKVLGFAMHMNQSNLTLFAESPASLIFAPLWKPSTWFLGALFFGIAFLLLLGRFFIMNLRDQIQVLAASFQDFSLGLQIPTQHQPGEFFQDFEPMISALNSGTHELKRKLELIKAPQANQPVAETEPRP